MHEHLAKCDMCDRSWHFWILLTIFGVGHFRFFTTRGSTELKADIQDLEPVGARKAQVNQMISYACIILFVFYRINIMIFKYILYFTRLRCVTTLMRNHMCRLPQLKKTSTVRAEVCGTVRFPQGEELPSKQDDDCDAICYGGRCLGLKQR